MFKTAACTCFHILILCCKNDKVRAAVKFLLHSGWQQGFAFS
jgi:hypothetical protein